MPSVERWREGQVVGERRAYVLWLEQETQFLKRVT